MVQFVQAKNDVKCIEFNVTCINLCAKCKFSAHIWSALKCVASGQNECDWKKTTKTISPKKYEYSNVRYHHRRAYVMNNIMSKENQLTEDKFSIEPIAAKWMQVEWKNRCFASQRSLSCIFLVSTYLLPFCFCFFFHLLFPLSFLTEDRIYVSFCLIKARKDVSY